MLTAGSSTGRPGSAPSPRTQVRTSPYGVGVERPDGFVPDGCGRRPEFVIRPRAAEDVPVLCGVLARQQPTSGYPLMWPLPFPVERFVVRDRELGAWVAELDGMPVGHVCITGVVDGDDGVARLWAEGAGVDIDRLGCVSAYFVDHDLRGRGVGGALLDAAVASVRLRGRVPVLDVTHGSGTAAVVFRRRGWREVGRARPSWLPEGAPPLILMTLPPQEARSPDA